MNEQHHEMILEKTQPSGAEEWHCPTCGRRILLQVPPANEMIIVEAGDQSASHSGGTGGLQVGPVQGVQRDKELGGVSEESLRPWIKAVENLDLNW